MNLVESGGYIIIQSHPPNGYSKTIIARPEQFYDYQKRYSKGGINEEEVIVLLKQYGFNIITHKKIIGFFAQLGWEIDYAIRRLNMKYIRTFSLSLLKLICSLDFLLPIGNKNEWIIIARRDGSTENP